MKLDQYFNNINYFINIWKMRGKIKILKGRDDTILSVEGLHLYRDRFGKTGPRSRAKNAVSKI
jgi:hypothetical protein